MEAVGSVVMVIEVVATTAGQPPAAAIVYVTVYVPAVLNARSTAPEEGLIERPTVLLYVPPAVPVRVTVAVPAFEQ